MAEINCCCEIKPCLAKISVEGKWLIFTTRDGGTTGSMKLDAQGFLALAMACKQATLELMGTAEDM